MTSPDGAKQNEYLEVTASLHVDGPLTPHVDEEWLEDPLRCPHCGIALEGWAAFGSTHTPASTAAAGLS